MADIQYWEDELVKQISEFEELVSNFKTTIGDGSRTGNL